MRTEKLRKEEAKQEKTRFKEKIQDEKRRYKKR